MKDKIGTEWDKSFSAIHDSHSKKIYCDKRVMKNNQLSTGNICSICGKSFQTERQLRSHVENKHPTVKFEKSIQKVLDINLKRNSFVDEAYSVAKHYSSSLGDRHSYVFACWDCDKKFKGRLLLRRHIATHAADSRRSGACDVCGKPVDNQLKLLVHMKSHRPKVLLTCKFCDKTFTFQSELSDHIKFAHESVKPYSCNICGKEFISHVGLEYHLRVHSGLYLPKPYVCTVCGHAFEKNCHLSYHMRTHTGDRPVLCTICGNSFARQGTLNRHMTSHRDERTLACQLCPSSFKDISSLARHMKIHSEHSCHICFACGKGFNTLGNLKVHMRTHSGECPYMCGVCGQSFPHQGTWKKHFDTHRD